MRPDEMAALHKAAFEFPRPWSAEEFTDLLSQKGSFVTGDTRCFALVRVLFDEAELLTIATAPAHRRQGHANAVMGEWQQRAAELGATQAFLEVAATNTSAIALYSQHGFEPSGRRKAYYRASDGAAIDAVVMTRSLTLR